MDDMCNEIISFLEEILCVEVRNPNVDIHLDLGVDGDDFSELIEQNAETFDIDMTAFKWYFHHDEEGFNIGRIFYKSPYQRVETIPVTPKMLAGFIPQKKWIIEYPEHQLPTKRYDLIIGTGLIAFLGVLLTVILFYK